MTAYHAEKGTYPAALADLAPSYVPEIPPDLFTGKPLIYRHDGAGCLLYSVGSDLEDNRGDAKKDQVIRLGGTK